MKQYLVIDFGGTLAKYSVMSENGEAVYRGEESAPLQDREAFLDFLADLYRRNSEIYEIQGVAVSMPGVIDEKKGYIHTAGAYLALYHMDLEKELKGRVSVPVTVENDGKCGALAEVWMGSLSENRDGIVIIIGTGIAGGIIKDRRLHKGSSLSAGEFSYILMGDQTDMTGTAMWKCSMSTLLFETARRLGIDVRKQANYPLLSQVADCSQELTDWNDRPEYASGLDGYQFFTLLNEGNETVMQAYDGFTSNLAKLCWNLQAVYGPEKILFGGGVTRQPRLIGDIQAQYDRIAAYFTSVMQFPCSIESCKFGNEANQYGALYHHLLKTGK